MAAAALKLQLRVIEVRKAADIDSAGAALKRERADGFTVLTDPMLLANRSKTISLAAQSRLPAIFYDRTFVDDGGLMSYSASIFAVFRRAATYVDKILKGTKPGDLPIEQPIKFEFIVNLKAAKQIGLTIPPNVLARADRVIK